MNRNAERRATQQNRHSSMCYRHPWSQIGYAGPRGLAILVACVWSSNVCPDVWHIGDLATPIWCIREMTCLMLWCGIKFVGIGPLRGCRVPLQPTRLILGISFLFFLLLWYDTTKQRGISWYMLVSTTEFIILQANCCRLTHSDQNAWHRRKNWLEITT